MSYISVSNLVCSINNLISIKKRFFFIDKSNYIISLLNKLVSLNYLSKFYIRYNKIMVLIDYEKNFFNVRYKIISKSSRKVFIRVKDLQKSKDKLYFISTNLGVFTSEEALKLRVGGEVILYIYNV